MREARRILPPLATVFVIACSTPPQERERVAESPREKARSEPKRLSFDLIKGEGDAGDPAAADGAIRWQVPLEYPISKIHVTPAGEIVALGPESLTVFDHRGHLRWHRNLAPGDTVLPSGDCLYIRFADGKTLTALDNNGSIRWERTLEGCFTPLGDGSILESDAAAIHSIECRQGRENWMFSPDRMRKLRLLSFRGDSLDIMGELGTRRVLYTLDGQGRLRSSTKIPPSSDWAARISDDGVLVRAGKTLEVMGSGGRVHWSRPIGSLAEVSRHGDDIIVAEVVRESAVRTLVLGRDGEERSECFFSAEAEPVALQIFDRPTGPILFAACAGPLSSCADEARSAGPYNRLWSCSDSGDVTSIVDQRSGLYFDMAQRDEDALVVATTADSKTTHVLRLSPDLERGKVARLPHRRMFGPVRGPRDLWLVATCSGPQCRPPRTLIALADSPP